MISFFTVLVVILSLDLGQFVHSESTGIVSHKASLRQKARSLDAYPAPGADDADDAYKATMSPTTYLMGDDQHDDQHDDVYKPSMAPTVYKTDDTKGDDIKSDDAKSDDVYKPSLSPTVYVQVDDKHDDQHDDVYKPSMAPTVYKTDDAKGDDTQSDDTKSDDTYQPSKAPTYTTDDAKGDDTKSDDTYQPSKAPTYTTDDAKTDDTKNGNHTDDNYPHDDAHDDTYKPTDSPSQYMNDDKGNQHDDKYPGGDDTKSDDHQTDDHSGYGQPTQAPVSGPSVDLAVSLDLNGITLENVSAAERDALRHALLQAGSEVTNVPDKYFSRPDISSYYSSSKINVKFHMKTSPKELVSDLAKANPTSVLTVGSSAAQMGDAFVHQMFAHAGEDYVSHLEDAINSDPLLDRLRHLNISLDQMPSVTVTTEPSGSPTSGPSGWWNRKHKIAVGAAIGGAMVIGVVGGAGYYARQRMVNVVKMDKDVKPRKLSSASTDDGSSNDIEMAHSAPGTPSVI